jgi:tetratricopeptide (TPR) repeat protein
MNRVKDLVVRLQENSADNIALKLCDTLAEGASNHMNYLDLAESYNVLKKSEKAADCLENALALCDNNEMLWNIRLLAARVYIDLGKFGKAKTYLEINKTTKTDAELQYLLNKVKENS